VPSQPSLTLVRVSDAVDEAAAEPPPCVEIASADTSSGELALESVALPRGAPVQHVGSWLLLGGLRELGFHDLAAEHRGDVPRASLRAAIDATAISLALGEGSVEGVRRIETPTVDTLLRRRGGISASWTTRVLHDFADVAAKTFPEAMASRLLTRTGEGEDRARLGRRTSAPGAGRSGGSGCSPRKDSR
jgi:hypothetical protein